MFEWFMNLLSPSRRRLRKAQSSTQFMSLQFGSTRGATITGTLNASTLQLEEPEDNREEVEPINIVHDLERDVSVDVDEIEAKLKVLYKRSDFHLKTLKRRSIPADLEHAILMLEARKNYPTLEARISWATTTKRRIDELLEKKKLEHRTVADFLPEFPEEAVAEIAKFEEVWTAATKGLFKKNPELDLSIIAPPDMFIQRRGDPILLAKSPFGDYYYILCAWDKEVDFVGELLGDNDG